MSLADLVNKHKRIILEVDIPELITEREVYGERNGSYKILVYENEGGTPHFHIILNKNYDNTVCVMILRNEYFTHNHHKATFTKGSDRKHLDSVLREVIPTKSRQKIIKDLLSNPDAEKLEATERIVTYYDAIVASWAFNGSKDNKISYDDIGAIEQPDYTTIMEYKHEKN